MYCILRFLDSHPLHSTWIEELLDRMQQMCKADKVQQMEFSTAKMSCKHAHQWHGESHNSSYHPLSCDDSVKLSSSDAASKSASVCLFRSDWIKKKSQSQSVVSFAIKSDCIPVRMAFICIHKIKLVVDTRDWIQAEEKKCQLIRIEMRIGSQLMTHDSIQTLIWKIGAKLILVSDG